MLSSSLNRRWMMAIAISAGISTTIATAYERDYDATSYVTATQEVAVEEAAPLQDAPAPTDAAAATAEQVSESPAPVAQESMSDLPAAQESAAQEPAPQDYAPAPCTCCNSTCCTKKKKEALTAKMKGAYKPLFYDNDFSYLNDRCYDGPSFLGDSLKGLKCGKLDVGGELRFRYHKEENMRGLGVTGRDDDFWLTRLRLFSNYRFNDHLRFYGEYLYAVSSGEDFPSLLIEENRSEIQNLFFDIGLTDRLAFRVGRQELLYGNQRLISPLDWANTRRTFDGVKAMYQGDVWNLDAFYVQPQRINFRDIDKPNPSAHFFGTYATRKDLAIGTLDAYYLGFVNTAGANDFDYHTIGSRVAGATGRGTLYEFEGGYQFGTNNPGFGDHNAGFVTGGLGRKLKLCTRCGEWNPTFWFWYDWASGGNDVPANRGDNGFDHLFPLAHKYNGFMDLFGRRNLNDVNMQFISPLGSRVKMLIWYHYFFLDQLTTPYNVTMSPYNPGNVAGSRDLGHEIDVLFTIAIKPRHSALVGYSHFEAGDYFSTTAGIPNANPPRADRDAEFFYFQYQMRF